jgi:hypothetical protein
MVRRSILLCLSLLSGLAYGQSCTTTLSAGATVSSSISSASGGDVICLNDGNYSGFTLTNVSKSPRVTIRAVNAGSANFTGNIEMAGSTSGLTFDGINYTGINATGTGISNLTFKNGDASKGTIVIDYVTTTAPNLLFENLTHYNQDASGFCHGGTINCVGAAGYLIGGSFRSNTNPVATIRGAYIDGGCADGIQTGSPVIVEYTYIANRRVGSCINDPHSDGFQFYGYPVAGSILRYNYWYDNAQMLAGYDYLHGTLIEHNVLDPGPVSDRDCIIELYADDGSIVRHNTVIIRGGRGKICLDHKPADPAGVNTQIYNNIALAIDFQNGSTASVNTKNLLSGGGGTNITGTATFVGTCSGGFANWRNCALAPGSAGKNAGTDGTDVGTHYYGVRKPGGLN